MAATDEKTHIVACHVGETCNKQTNGTCKHRCDVRYNNGKTETRILTGFTLTTNRYWDVLSDEDKAHFLPLQSKMATHKYDEAEYKHFIDYEKTALRERPVVACHIGNTCFKSYPCQHECLVRYGDGTSKILCLSGWELTTNRYWDALSDNAKKHFVYLKVTIEDHSHEEQYQHYLSY